MPSLARFATPDPAGIAAAWNQNDAFAGDPVNLIDPDGAFPGQQALVDASAGFGDSLLSTFCFGFCNPGAALRSLLGIDDKVDMCSTAYGEGRSLPRL